MAWREVHHKPWLRGRPASPQPKPVAFLEGGGVCGLREHMLRSLHPPKRHRWINHAAALLLLRMPCLPPRKKASPPVFFSACPRIPRSLLPRIDGCCAARARRGAHTGRRAEETNSITTNTKCTKQAAADDDRNRVEGCRVTKLMRRCSSFFSPQTSRDARRCSSQSHRYWGRPGNWGGAAGPGARSRPNNCRIECGQSES
jgi:hypothetical protein